MAVSGEGYQNKKHAERMAVERNPSNELIVIDPKAGNAVFDQNADLDDDPS